MIGIHIYLHLSKTIHFRRNLEHICQAHRLSFWQAGAFEMAQPVLGLPKPPGGFHNLVSKEMSEKSDNMNHQRLQNHAKFTCHQFGRVPLSDGASRYIDLQSHIHEVRIFEIIALQVNKQDSFAEQIKMPRHIRQRPGAPLVLWFACF